MKKNLVLAALLSAASFSALASGNLEAGKAIAEKSCATCHGKDLKSPIDPSYPILAGQKQDYLVHALKSYQRGASGANGRSNPIMGGQAKALSQQDIEDVAAYLHSLPGPLVLKK